MTMIIQWAEKYLLSKGYVISNVPEEIRITPWSSVTRFSTSKGYIYLKQTPPMLALEPIIIQILHDQCHANVPIMIEINRDFNCFLTADSGKPLREIFKGHLQLDVLCKGIKNYTFIQCAAVEHINTFLMLGVPDWRLENLPKLYNRLIDQEDLLREDGLTMNELSVLHELHPKLSSLCELLSHYKVPETLDHCDFHDNNILIEEDTNKMTIIDLGETVITHPFFSLITCVQDAAFRYSFKETDRAYLELQDACFENWLKFELKDNLLEVIFLTKKLWPIYAALGEYRLMVSSNKEEFKSLNRRGRLARDFKKFIEITTLQ